MNDKLAAQHKQVCVKVNAYVDEKIAPVIEALSNIHGIVTEFSCEDNRSELEAGSGYIPRAYIIFHYKGRHDDWRGLCEECNSLSKAISAYPHAEISVFWREGKPAGKFEFNTEDAYWLTQAITKFTNNST